MTRAQWVLVAAMPVFAAVVVVAWVRSRFARAERIARLEALVAEGDARDARRAAAMRAVAGGAIVPRPDLGPCPLAMLESASRATLATEDDRGALMSALARDAAALREPPAPPRAWTQEIDVLPARGVVMLYDFAGERALCAGALAGDDDPRGALVKAGPP